MPFKDTKEGQTHSYNDGCGEPEHNDLPPNKQEEFTLKVGETFTKEKSDLVMNHIQLLISQALSSQRSEIVEMIESMKKEVCGCTEDEEWFNYHTKECDMQPYGYNQALQDLLTKLQEM